jgi:hypothetical protein
MTNNNKIVKMAEEYVTQVGAAEAVVMAIHIFYEAMKTLVAEGHVSHDTLSDKGLLEQFGRYVKGYKGNPSVFEKTGVSLRRYD